MNYSQLNIDTIYEAEQVLADVKYFNIGDDIERKNEFRERFLNTISFLNNDERELFYKLVRSFTSISSSMFDQLLYKSTTKMKCQLNNIKNIFVLPVITEFEIENSKTKSGHSIVYFMKSIFAEIFEDCYNIEFLSSPQGLDVYMKRDESIILFCDDFVGSGNQFLSAFSYYKKYSTKNDICMLISIAILNAGYKVISDLGIKIYSEIVMHKGISDNVNIEDKKNALTVIDEIEDKLRVDIDYRRGFSNSEALIAINKRAPDNTFPIFWWKYNEKKAIFARK